ncbi:MAG: DUF3306 domain-containing protein [Gammaproteobacteria bacterium]
MTEKTIDAEKSRRTGLLRRWFKESKDKPHSESAQPDRDSPKEQGAGAAPGSSDLPLDAESLAKLAELKTLFQRPEFSVLDGLNEYDRDYTGYRKLDGVLTREFKRFLARSVMRENSDGPAITTAADADLQDTGSSRTSIRDNDLESGPDDT